MDEFVLILGMSLVTFGVRYPVLALVGRMDLPVALVRALRYAPPAILAAIIAPAVLAPGGAGLAVHLDNPRLVAGSLATLVAWRTKNLLWTILAGMAGLWLWQAVIS